MKWSIGQDGGGQMHKSFAVKIKEVSVCASLFSQFPSLRPPLLPRVLGIQSLKKKKKSYMETDTKDGRTVQLMAFFSLPCVLKILPYY